MDGIDEPDEVAQDLPIDGMVYWLIAARTLGGFHAAWGCDRCDETGYCEVHKTSDEAIAAAKVEALRHHVANHANMPGHPR